MAAVNNEVIYCLFFIIFERNELIVYNFFNQKGNSYIWNLTGGFGDVPLRLSARDTVYHPHKRYALKCLFSPDST